MYGLIAAEAAIFTIFVVAYLFYIGKSLTGPLPSEVLHAPILLTICLVSSSLTIHFAVTALRRVRVSAFMLWWAFTIALGAVFLGGTAREWHHLIYDEGLTIRTNLPRHGRPAGSRNRIAARTRRTCQAGAHGTSRRVVHVLALRRRGLGCRLHRGLRHRALRHGSANGHRITHEDPSRSAEHSRSSCADRMADRARVWHDPALRRLGDERVRHRSRSHSHDRGWRWLVPRRSAARGS